jgi:tetratricopeptide (TPR) repeat protein
MINFVTKISRSYVIVVYTLLGTVQVLTMTQPSRAEAHHNRGAVLLANEEYKKALIELNKAISIDPLDANFRHTRAWALWRLQQTQQALDELKFAIHLSPASNLLDSLGSFLFMLGQHDQALRIFSKAISKASSSAEAALYLRKRGATFLALDQTEFALLDLNKAVEINPTDPLNYRERAEVYHTLDRLDEAIDDCSIAISSVKDDPVLYKRRGECYFQQGKLGLAMDDAQSAIKIAEHYSDGHLLLGKVLLEDGQVSIAMQFFVTAFSFNHKCAEAYLHLALCFDLLKSPKEAHQYARKAAAIDSNYKKYTLEATRLTLISPNSVQRLQAFSANVHELYPEMADDDGEQPSGSQS